MIKSEQYDQEQYEKSIIELKVRAAKFDKSSITSGRKLFRSRKISERLRLLQSMGITDLEITLVSVLLCLNCFYYQANLKLLNFL